ncbi:MAG: hypothetical protein ACR2PK_17315, partial [Acidimicrobiales bacterium]
MRKNNWLKLLAVLLAFGLIAAACGDDDDDTAAEDPPATEDDGGDDGSGDDGGDDGSGDDGGDDGGAGASLAGVCPDPMIIQSDWFPESEHGAIYELIGDDYEVDGEQKSVAGTMQLGGQDLGIQVEVRAGGPAIGSQPVQTVMATDDAITLGYGSTDSQILRFEENSLLSVLAPLEMNPQIVMWDPEGIPEAESIADLGEIGTTIQVFSAGTWSDVLVGLGVINADQIDPSYDGSPARFIAEGD